jgi:glycosyltransferase involved in cell wall biosynthesis
MYNVEPYLERCIRSLENQDIPNNDYEIICINDGSPDNSRAVIVHLQQEFNNIILIDQENQGVSRARNNGIDKAYGTYLLFIDPDDYIESNSLGRVLKTSEDQNAQVSFLGYTILNKDDRIHKVIIYDVYEGRVFPGTEAYYLSRGDGETDPDRMWAVLFKKEFLDLNNLRYLPDVPYLEDGEFIARILCLAERCIFVRHSFYQRTTRPGSATNSDLFHSEKATNGFLLAASNLKRFQQENNLNEKQKRFLNQPIVHFINLLIASGGKPFSFKRLQNLRKKIFESGLRKVNLDSVIQEYAMRGYLYNRSIYLLLIYQFLINGIHSLYLKIKSPL